jgi:hypothetical protein
VRHILEHEPVTIRLRITIAGQFIGVETFDMECSGVDLVVALVLNVMNVKHGWI